MRSDGPIRELGDPAGTATLCGDCGDGRGLAFDFSFAFQPIIDVAAQRIFAYEALARLPGSDDAGSLFRHVDRRNRHAFDQAVRRRAIETACRHGLHGTGARLAINFLPNAIADAANCIRPTLAAARRAELDPSRLIFEMVEQEPLDDAPQAREMFSIYRALGIAMALDDFGMAHSGLVRLAELDPDILKLDMCLVRGIENSARKRSIVAAVSRLCRDLDIRLIAEGIETEAEAATVRELGISLMQGFLFGRPAFERLEPPRL